MQHRLAVATMGAALAAATLAGCATPVAEGAPAWFAEQTRVEQAAGFPELQDVPTEATANTNQRYWNSVAADVIAAREAMQANPRSEPAPPTDPAGFDREAREVIEDTAATH